MQAGTIGDGSIQSSQSICNRRIMTKLSNQLSLRCSVCWCNVLPEIEISLSIYMPLCTVYTHQCSP